MRWKASQVDRLSSATVESKDGMGYKGRREKIGLSSYMGI